MGRSSPNGVTPALDRPMADDESRELDEAIDHAGFAYNVGTETWMTKAPGLLCASRAFPRYVFLRRACQMSSGDWTVYATCFVSVLAMWVVARYSLLIAHRSRRRA